MWLEVMDNDKFMTHAVLIIFLLAMSAYGKLTSIKDSLCTHCLLNTADSIPVYGYEIVNTYNHDSMAFTQGLTYEDGFLYEGTGQYGHSSLRKVELETGNVIKIHDLSSNYFGEGVTIYNDSIIQLTWLNNIGFVYIEQDSFVLIDSFSYPWAGWGLTHDDTCLILSDGTSTLHFLDPHTYTQVGTLYVQAESVPVYDLNELEYIQGKIYANLWNHDSIAIIDPVTGDVTEWINLAGILNAAGFNEDPDVLNGIAYDPTNVRLFVTGKLWPTLFEITIEPLNYPPTIVFFYPPSPVYVPIDSTVLLGVSVEDPDPGDTLVYVWSVDGEIDTSAHDSIYAFSNGAQTCDTVVVTVDDGMFRDSTLWVIYVSSVLESACHPLTSYPSLYVSPNPVQDHAYVEYIVPQQGRVLICLYNAIGRRVATLQDAEMAAGCYGFTFEAGAFAPGVYFIQVNGCVSEKVVRLQ